MPVFASYEERPDSASSDEPMTNSTLARSRERRLPRSSATEKQVSEPSMAPSMPMEVIKPCKTLLSLTLLYHDVPA